MGSLDMFVTLLILLSGLCAVESKTCPASSEMNVQDVFFDANNQGNFQLGLWHRIPCQSYRSGENLLAAYWFRGQSVSDPNKVVVNGYANNQYFQPISDRYTFSSEFSLVVKDVRESDAGRYICQVVPHSLSARDDKTDMQVIGDTFPSCATDASSNATFQRGRRQTLPCECASQVPDAHISVVYWSTGEGVTMETQIIGARFSDGTLVQFQDGADYSINSDSSLTINFLSGLSNASRFWCHVFMADLPERNCYFDVHIEEENPADYRLQASATSFYIEEGRNQTIPCIAWTPSDHLCMVQWFKVDTSLDRHLILNYSLSTDDIDAYFGFSVGDGFGLSIISVHDAHTGRYMCIPESNSTDESAVDVHVFGDSFPLDNGTVISNITVTYDPSKKQELNCTVGTKTIGMNKSTVFWSYGPPEATTPTLIGRLNLPGGKSELSQLAASGCFGITSAGNLLLNKCLQRSDFRYWCHVFPYGDVLQRSYVDVIIKSPDQYTPATLVIVICVCLSAMVIVAVGVSLLSNSSN